MRTPDASRPSLLADDIHPVTVVVLTHTRPEPMTGVPRRVDRGPGRTMLLGYTSRGGTLDVAGMLFANRCSWAHAVAAAAAALGVDPHAWLDAAERDALAARADPGPILAPIRSGRVL